MHTAVAKKKVVKFVKPRVRPELWSILRDPLNRRVPPPPPPSLTELAQEHGSDKWGSHRYTPHYERHLQHLRNKRITVLEIGIGGYAREGQGGASLRMWRDFFTKASIVGLDIEDKSFVDAERIQTYKGSQTDPEMLQRIIDETGPIKVIVDDGSHRPEHIRQSFAYLFPRLANDGYYIIEDTQTSYWPHFGGSELLSAPETTMALVKDLLDGLNYEEFLEENYTPTYTDVHVRAVHTYHNLVVIEKGDNKESSRRHRRRGPAPDVPSLAEQRAPLSVPQVTR